MRVGPVGHVGVDRDEAMGDHLDPSSTDDRPPKADRILRVLEDVIRHGGVERVGRQKIIEAHADLMPELDEELDALRRVEQAEQQASSPAVSPPVYSSGRLPSDSIPGYDHTNLFRTQRTKMLLTVRLVTLGSLEALPQDRDGQEDRTMSYATYILHRVLAFFNTRADSWGADGCRG